MPTTSPKVVIIGGGLGGPALALALQKRNICSVLFELRPKSTARDGGYLALAPNALRVLKSIGVYEQISSQGYNFEDLVFVSGRNLSMIGQAKNGSEQLFGFKAVRVQRHVIRQTLLAEVEKRGIEIRYGSKCVEIFEEEKDRASTQAGPVGVKFADGTIEYGDIVVGTDGIHSRVRRYIDPAGKSNPVYSGLMGLGGTIARSSLPAASQEMHLPCLIMGKNNSFAMIPGNPSGSLVGFFATIEAPEKSREEWAKADEDKQYLHKSLNERHNDPDTWPEMVIEVCKKAPLESLTSWPYYEIPELTSWTSPSRRVMVIGDAAHALPPTGGQGAAMAFEDGSSLADALSYAFSPSSSSSSDDTIVFDPSVLQHWQSHRQARIKRITAFTHRGGDMRREVRSTFAQILREWVMWLMLWWINLNGIGKRMGWIYAYRVEEWRDGLLAPVGPSVKQG